MYVIQLPICRFGPLVQYWYMRYEAKHSFFKKMASIIGNYTNLPYTLAKRHQQQQCYHFASTATYVSVVRDTLWKRCMNVLAPAN